MPDRQEHWAVFWCSLLSPLLYGEIPPEEAGRFIDQLASADQVFPDGQRRRPSRATLWRKWKKYRDGGFEALFRKRRSDRGQPRKHPPAMIAKAVELKKEQPRRSNVPINQFLQAEFRSAIPKSTLYRHLKRAGATRLKLGISQQKVRRRWTRDQSNALWLGDFEDGPCVLVGDPPPGGLIERFFETAQGQLESEVRAGEILTLDRLNHALAAWLDQSYHQQPNSETGQSPLERYHQGNRFTRHVNLQEVLKYFMRKVRRTVHEEFSDVQVDGFFFEVDAGLRGDRVEVRYDPFSPLETVFLYSAEGEYLGMGRRYERDTARQQPPQSPPSRPKHNYLDLLIQKHEQALRDRHAGIDYQAVLAAAGRRWPLAEFVKQLAAHLGRKGGLTAFTTDELETLQRVYQRLTSLDAPMLREACQRANSKTIPDIVFVLQQLAHQQERKR